MNQENSDLGSSEDVIRYRMEQAEEALSDAKFLAEGMRGALSIVNRSYYAMFYAVLALLQTIGRSSTKHSGVIALFDSEFVHRGIFSKEFSINLHEAFDLRQVSDYRLMKKVNPERALDILSKADRFVNAIASHLKKT